jgi:hypothetical protein
VATATHHHQWNIEARVVVGHHAEQSATAAAFVLTTQ